jgi:hypothetical protein
MSNSSGKIKVKVADETWIAAALLHREDSQRPGFRISEIVDRAAQEGLHTPLRPGVQVHATLHCVAGRRPNGGHYRMLTETEDGGRRLFRTGDPVHAYRGGKMYPRRDEIPEAYRYLIDWYVNEYNPGAADEER